MNTQTTAADATTRVETTRWQIDPTRSSVEFHVKGFWGIQTVKGHFARYHGTLDLAAQPEIELVIEADSLDTHNKRRDVHLRSPEFFDAERHPYVRFVSDSVTLAGERLSVRGRLHARGESVPLELEATLRQVDGELVVEAVTEADRRELGMTWNMMGMVATTCRLIVSGRLVANGAAR